MAEPPGVRRFLTFRSAAHRYALPAEEVSEVIRVPPLARVPQAPPSLLGLGNLRGTVLPVASLRGLLGQDGGAAGGRAIVLDRATPVALAVDAVDGLVTVGEDRLETRQAELAAEPGERLRGAFPAERGPEVVKILDIESLLAATFARQARPPRARSDRVAAPAAAEAAAERRMLVTFEVAGQEFGLALADVQAIAPAPDRVSALPRADSAVVGVTAYRETLLPLLSLRGLLGLPRADAPSGREKLVVAKVRGALVGLLVDRMRDIVRADAGLVEPTPSVLAARTGGEARIEAIYRGEAGRRLVPILSPDQLFREDVMRRLAGMAGADAGRTDRAGAVRGREVQILVFRLGDEEFGLPIEAVDEVGAAPERVARVPKTPKFLEGVINLRGEVLPVLDQRRRFGMPAAEPGSRRRMIVVRSGTHRAGLLVDGVSEVLRVEAERIAPGPALTGEAVTLVNGVINLEDAGRIVLLLDPAELLSRAERGLLDRLDGGPDGGLEAGPGSAGL